MTMIVHLSLKKSTDTFLTKISNTVSTNGLHSKQQTQNECCSQ